MKKKFLNFDGILILAIAVFFVSLVLLKVPLHYPYIINFDESVALVLAYVTKQGYRLYDQVWHDHLSGLSLLLNTWFSFTGFSLYSARILVLSLATILLAVFYLLLRIQCGILASFLSTLALSTSFVYITLSTAIARELPSIFFVVLSIFLVFKSVKSSVKFRYWLYFLSAICFVFSLQIKLSGITAIPTIALIIFLNQNDKFLKKILDIVIWLGIAGVVFLLGSLTIFPFSYSNVIQSHVSVSSAFNNSDSTLINLLQEGIKNEPIYFLVTLIAIAALVFSRNIPNLLPPLVWLGFNLLRFSSISPIWSHYYIHLVLPAIWIIGLFLEQLKIDNIVKNFKQLPTISTSLILKLIIIFALASQFLFNTLRIFTNRDPLIASYNQQARDYKTHPIEVVLEKFKNTDKVLLTDNPHYIYKFFLKTPPETAVITRKRLINENLNGDFILDVIKKRKPDFVFLYRFENEFLQSPQLTNFLQKNYIEYKFKGKKGRFFMSPETEKDYQSKLDKIERKR